MGNATILVVDDNLENLRMFLAALAESGFKNLIAENGADALYKAEVAQPDLILLDVLMPGMDGFETCQRLKANAATKEIPVIFMTALADLVNKVHGFEVGGADYLTKPFQQEEMLARVKAHLTIRQQQKYIRQQNQLLQELNANKDKFFSIIAHDLRSPFAGLLAIAQLIKENLAQWGKVEIKNFTDKLQASAENLYALLENLLTWARIQQGVIESEPQPFDLRSVVARNVSLFSANAEQKQITLRSVLTETLVVYADARMVDTVMRNLVANAIKFTPTGGTITISARQADAAVEVAVADTGIGIPENSLPKLFRIETTYHKTGTAGEKGTGLGLILCKDLVEKNGGRIWVNSAVGAGATFTFTLPKAL